MSKYGKKLKRKYHDRYSLNDKINHSDIITTLENIGKNPNISTENSRTSKNLLVKNSKIIENMKDFRDILRVLRIRCFPLKIAKYVKINT
jgi:predicted Zn-dependent peptidase